MSISTKVAYIIMVIIGFTLGVVLRVILSLLGAARLEGLIIALAIINIADPELLTGFFIALIGTKALSIPADTFINANSRRDPFLHSLKQSLLKNGEGHSIIKQSALVHTVVFTVILTTLSLFASVLTKSDAFLTIALSPIAILILQLLFILIRWKENKIDNPRWIPHYLIGLAIYTLVAKSFLPLGNGFGMLIAINLLFLSLDDFWIKGKIPEQYPIEQSNEWAKNFSISFTGVTVGFISGLFIGCPTSMATNCIISLEQDYTSERTQLNTQLAAGASTEALQLGLWLLFGYSRSSYADALGKANLEVESIISFVVATIIISILSLLILDWWSKTYLGIMRILGKLINLICCILIIALSIQFVGLIPILIGVTVIVALSSLKLPEESKIAVMGVIPLISINWLAML